MHARICTPLPDKCSMSTIRPSTFPIRALPHRLVSDGWWLSTPVPGPSAVILPFPLHGGRRALSANTSSGEQTGRPSHHDRAL